MKFAPGERFDRYTIEAVLGEGGMARVYRAHDAVLHRHVALKVVDFTHGDAATAREAASFILHEARAAAALDHPNVVSIHDVGEIETAAFIAMELIEGRSLRSYIGDTAVPIHDRVRWLVEVARALSAAHKRGLVHRDVKPENVMVRDDGVVKVLDFGIARRPNARPVDANTPKAALPFGDVVGPHTLAGQGGTLLGTPRYMAPEQMSKDPVDARADQFAWGVVAYELLAGKNPWRADDQMLLLAEILTRTPEPLASVAKDVPPRVASVVTRALEKSPDERFSGVDEIVRALEPYAQGPRALSSKPPPRPSPLPPRSGPARPLAMKLAVAGAACAVVFGGALLIRRAVTTTTPSQGATPPGGGAGAGAVCTSSAACTRAAGKPSICRDADGVCAPLESEDCRLLSEPGDEADDATIWLGTMFPMTGEDADAFGKESVNALDLARRELSSIAHGIPPAEAGGRARPIALVTCDDAVDPRRAASHLAVDLGVPAVIGFHGSQEVIDLATSVFIPNGVLAMATQNRSSLIATIPQRPGEPRLVFRTTVNSAESVQPVSKLVSEVLEPELRAAATGVLGKDEPMRVAFLHPRSTAGLSAADALFSHLVFNGKPALDNGASYHDFPYPDPMASDAAPDFSPVVKEVVDFRPHVIVYMTFNGVTKGLLAPIEEAWPARAKFRPRYVGNGYLVGDDVFSFVGKSASLRERFFGVNPATNNVVNAKMTARYNASYSPKVSVASGPASVYDAFYVLAYAAYAAGEGPLTGSALARGIARLVPPGTPLEVGPTAIFDAFNALRGGDNVDLTGAASGLDFDPTSGDSPADFAVLCVKGDTGGAAAEVVESGVTYEARSKRLIGLPLRCP